MANQQVANLLVPQLPFALFRHQALPSQLRWDELREWAAAQGLALPPEPARDALTKLSNQLPPEAALTGQLYVRAAMSPAVYNDTVASHFSLGYETYTHFTSPIRRYADLMVHRLLLGDVQDNTHGFKDVTAVAQHCSERARSAKFAERYVWDKLKKRALCATVEPTSPLMAYVISQSKFGVRAVVLPWQCMVNVTATSLQQAGMVYDSKAGSWAETGVHLSKGTYLLVESFCLEEFKAAVDVNAALVRPLGLMSEDQVTSSLLALER
jgi:ribonuclease R